MATSTSRATVRKAFAALLSNALVGSGKPAQAVFDYQSGDFQNMSSVVVFSSGSSERGLGSLGPCWTTKVALWVHVFVLYADPDSGWTEADAEDTIDEIEASIADVVLVNMSNANWDRISYSEPTSLGSVEIGGHEYRREVIKLEMEVVT